MKIRYMMVLVLGILFAIINFVILQWFTLRFGITEDLDCFVLDIGIWPLTGWCTNSRLFSWYTGRIFRLRK